MVTRSANHGLLPLCNLARYMCALPLVENPAHPYCCPLYSDRDETLWLTRDKKEKKKKHGRRAKNRRCRINDVTLPRHALRKYRARAAERVDSRRPHICPYSAHTLPTASISPPSATTCVLISWLSPPPLDGPSWPSRSKGSGYGMRTRRTGGRQEITAYQAKRRSGRQREGEAKVRVGG